MNGTAVKTLTSGQESKKASLIRFAPKLVAVLRKSHVCRFLDDRARSSKRANTWVDRRRSAFASPFHRDRLDRLLSRTPDRLGWESLDGTGVFGSGWSGLS